MQKIVIFLFVLITFSSCRDRDKPDSVEIPKIEEFEHFDKSFINLKMTETQSLCDIYNTLGTNKNITIFLSKQLAIRTSHLYIYKNKISSAISSEELLAGIVLSKFVDLKFVTADIIAQWQNQVENIPKGVRSLNECELHILKEVNLGELSSRLEGLVEQEKIVADILSDEKIDLSRKIKLKLLTMMRSVIDKIDVVQSEDAQSIQNLNQIFNRVTDIDQYAQKVSVLNVDLDRTFFLKTVTEARKDLDDVMQLILPEGAQAYFLIFNKTKYNINTKIEELLY